MSRSAIRDTAARLLAEKNIDLDTWLLKQRSAGTSYEKIAVALHDDTGGLINVTSRTIARWCVGLEEAAA